MDVLLAASLKEKEANWQEFLKRVDELHTLFKKMDEKDQKRTIDALKYFVQKLIDSTGFHDSPNDLLCWSTRYSYENDNLAPISSAAASLESSAGDHKNGGRVTIVRHSSDKINVERTPSELEKSSEINAKEIGKHLDKNSNRNTPIVHRRSKQTRTTRRPFSYEDSDSNVDDELLPAPPTKKQKFDDEKLDKSFTPVKKRGRPPKKSSRKNPNPVKLTETVIPIITDNQAADVHTVQPIKIKLKSELRQEVCQLFSDDLDELEDNDQDETSDYLAGPDTPLVIDLQSNEAEENSLLLNKQAVDVKSVDIVPEVKSLRSKYRIEHKCQICSQIFKHGRPYKRHLQMHGSDSVCCKLCKKEFSNTALYTDHKALCDKMNVLLFKCNQCTTKCRTKTSLNRHVRLKHSSVPSDFKCLYCQEPRYFGSKLTLYKHYREHAGSKFVCLQCGVFIVGKDEYYAHVTSHKRKRYFCKRCNETFLTRSAFLEHKRTHVIKCHVCDNVIFSRKSEFFEHIRLEHPDEQKYQCSECPRKFFRPKHLEQHVKIHKVNGPVKCELCDIFFTTTRAFRKHELTNSHLLKAGKGGKERTHLCALCGQAYFRKYALQRHMKTHTDVRPHKCPHCDYTCREPTNLKRHILRHFPERNFICEVCGDAFHTKKTLETHVVYRHSTDRKYQCSKCTQSFKTANALSRHQSCHSQIKPFQCWCGSTFNRQYNLRRHMKSVHGTDRDMPPPRKVKLLEECKEEAAIRDREIEKEVSEAISQEIAKVRSQMMLPSSAGIDIVARSFALSGGFTDEVDTIEIASNAESEGPESRSSIQIDNTSIASTPPLQMQHEPDSYHQPSTLIRDSKPSLIPQPGNCQSVVDHREIQSAIQPHENIHPMGQSIKRGIYGQRLRPDVQQESVTPVPGAGSSSAMSTVSQMDALISDIVYQRTPIPQANYERTIQCMPFQNYVSMATTPQISQSRSAQHQAHTALTDHKYLPQSSMPALFNPLYPDHHNHGRHGNIIHHQQQQSIISCPNLQQLQQQSVITSVSNSNQPQMHRSTESYDSSVSPIEGVGMHIDPNQYMPRPVHHHHLGTPQHHHQSQIHQNHPS